MQSRIQSKAPNLPTVEGSPALQVGTISYCNGGWHGCPPLPTTPFSYKFSLFLPTGKDKLLIKPLSFLYCRWQHDVFSQNLPRSCFRPAQPPCSEGRCIICWPSIGCPVCNSEPSKVLQRSEQKDLVCLSPVPLCISHPWIVTTESFLSPSSVYNLQPASEGRSLQLSLERMGLAHLLSHLAGHMLFSVISS